MTTEYEQILSEIGELKSSPSVRKLITLLEVKAQESLESSATDSDTIEIYRRQGGWRFAQEIIGMFR